MATPNEVLICPITLTIFTDPVSANDGHTYERQAIEAWIRQHGTSPMTRERLSLEDLHPNRAVKDVIDSFETLARKQKYQFTLNVDVRKKESRPLFQTYGKSIYRAQWLPTNDNRPDIVILKIDGARANKEASFYVDLTRHPHIIRTFGFVRDNENNMNENTVILLQEYAREGNLYEQLQDRPAILNENVLIEIFLQIIDAMIYLVFNNVIHGDLACRNVLVFRFDESNPKNNLVKITDFGLSRHSQLYSLQSGAAQTVLNIIPTRYVAPEIFSTNGTNDIYTEKSDVYSMGVLMWEAYSRGTIPWSNISNDADIVRHVLNGNYLPQPPNCTQNYWNIILKTWANSPINRPTFGQLRHALNEYYYKKENGSVSNMGIKYRLEVPSDKPSTKTNTIQSTTVKKLQEMTQPVFDTVQGILATTPRTSSSVSSLISKKLSSLINPLHKDTTTVPTEYQNRRLEQRIAHIETYSIIDLDEQQIADEDMEIVVREATIRKQCVQLLLRRNQITSVGIRTLADAMRNNNTLEELYLTHNQISDKGIQILAQALAVNNNTLRNLSLGWNRITDKGAEYLTEMLKTNTKLLRIGLFNNEIGDRGVRLLCKVLTTYNKSLQGLSLDENTSISATSVDSLLDMIKHNQTMQELSINKCGLSQKSVTKLRKTAEAKGHMILYCD